MPQLALIQQCCFGAGYTRGGGLGSGIFVPVDHDYSIPCWASGGILHPLIGSPGSALGYDSDRNWLIASAASISGDSVYGTSTGGGGVYYNDFANCTSGSGLYYGTLIDEATAEAILDTTVPTPRTSFWWWGSVFSHIGKAGEEYRLYGMAEWFDTDYTLHLKGFSTRYDGSDYQVEYTQTIESPSGDNPNWNHTICNGSYAIVSNVDTDGSLNQGRINGGTLIDKLAFPNFLGWTALSTAAQTPVGDFILGYGFRAGFGGDPDEQQITFGFVIGDDTYRYYPVTMGWSDKYQGLMTLWARGSDPAEVPPPSYRYMTLATGPVTPGNIIGQEGVSVYEVAQIGAGYGYGGWGSFGERLGGAAGWMLPINWCNLPAPITDFTPAPPDPDPPPPPPNCDQYADCDEFTEGIHINVQGFVIQEPTLEDPGGALEHTAEWFPVSANQQWSLDNAPTMDGAYVHCVSNDKDGFIVVVADWLFTGTAEEKYAERGDLLWRRDTYEEDHVTEWWVAGFAVKVACVEGLIYITSFHVILQEFTRNWVPDDGDYTDFYPFVDIDCESYSTDLDRSGALMKPASCITGEGVMTTTFEYKPGFWFTVAGYIGPVEEIAPP